MKKRFSALFLALALCLGLAVPAFAADENAAPEITCQGPENSGIIYESQATDAGVIGFARSGSNNAHITYGTLEDWGSGVLRLVPKGVDIVVTGVQSAEDIELSAFSPIDIKGVTRLFCRLFAWEDGKDVSLVPLDMDEPMGFEYDDPQDGKNHVAGHVTAADAGFQANEDGDVVLNSERLYALLGEGNVLRIVVGNTFGFYQLSGEPKLISDVFTDVPVGNWVTDPVVWAVQNNITNGTEKDKFSPAQNCTNAQILTFIWRAYGEPEPTVENPFTNSIPDGYAKAAVWAYEKGMVSGTTFDVDKPCTRAMAMTYLWQAAGSPETEPTGKFTDVAASDPYAQAVAWAVANGITKGATDTTFAPENICQRGQIAVFLYNAVAKN